MNEADNRLSNYNIQTWAVFVGDKTMHIRQENPKEQQNKQRERCCCSATCLSWFKLQSKNQRPLKCHLCFWGEPKQQRSHIEREPNHTMPGLDGPREHYSLPGFMDALLSLKLHSWVWLQHRLSFTHPTFSPVSFTCISSILLVPPLSLSLAAASIFTLFPPLELPLLLSTILPGTNTSSSCIFLLFCPLFLLWYDVIKDHMDNIEDPF